MKIPQSVRILYQELRPKYDQLKEEVDRLIGAKKERRWHYEGRVKDEESFALKMETGRVRDPAMPEDFFACTVVVENHSRIADAEEAICSWFKLDVRRPKDAAVTHLEPFSFDFDDLRLYVRWADDPAAKPTGLNGVLFEVQVKTFLQHAWGIATHDFVYKSEAVDWPMSRIAYQVKAMLENAELSIAEAKKLTDSAMIKRSDYRSQDLSVMIAEIKKRWGADQLPKDLRRMAHTLDEMIWVLKVDFKDLWQEVDEATAAGEGAKTLNLSPHGAILAALMRKRGERLFEPLASNGREMLFVPLEVDLPPLSARIGARIVRPPVKP